MCTCCALSLLLQYLLGVRKQSNYHIYAMLPHARHALARITLLPRNCCVPLKQFWFGRAVCRIHNILAFVRSAWLESIRVVYRRATLHRSTANKTLFAYICSRSPAVCLFVVFLFIRFAPIYPHFPQSICFLFAFPVSSFAPFNVYLRAI